MPAVSSLDVTARTNRFVSGVASYDAAGNITTDSKFRSLTYAYDANGRQTSASNGTWTETQVYDSAGQRVQTTANSVTRTMVFDVFGQDVADYSGSTLERENIYRGGQLVATYEAGTSSWKYVMQDEKGSTRAAMNNNGSSSSVIARHDYLPFGEEIASGIGLRTSGQGFAATDTNRKKYAMTERDDVSGLDHTWWRKYESFSGRWTSPDPLSGNIGDPQSFNAYTYSANDPVNLIDPSGLLWDFPEASLGFSHFANGFWGGGSLAGNGWGNDPRPGFGIIQETEKAWDITLRRYRRGGREGFSRNWISDLDQEPQESPRLDLEKIRRQIKEENRRKALDSQARREFDDCVQNNPAKLESDKRMAGAALKYGVRSFLPITSAGRITYRKIRFGTDISKGYFSLAYGTVFSLILNSTLMSADLENEDRALVRPLKEKCMKETTAKYGFRPSGR